MLLRDFAEKNRCIFVESVDSWEESIRKSCEPLMAEGIVDGSYAEEIIETVKNVGPYIVIIPVLPSPTAWRQRGARDRHKLHEA